VGREADAVCAAVGKNSSLLNVPFLNLMANLVQRGGAAHLRLGGNTQETATLVGSLPDGKILEKDYAGVSNPTATPPLDFTPDVLYMMANISALVNARWYLGIPFNDTANLRLAIAEYGEAVLGDTLLGFQVGNEPDLYADHGHRNGSYGPYDYFGEFGVVVDALASDTAVPTKNRLIAPSVATGDWTPEMVWDTGFIPTYADSLGALAVEHYPDDNCFAQYGIGAPRDPQTVFPNYLNHTAGQALVAAYLNSSAIAVANGKPFLMFETNTGKHSFPISQNAVLMMIAYSLVWWLPGRQRQFWRGHVGTRLCAADGIHQLLRCTVPRRRAERVLQRMCPLLLLTSLADFRSPDDSPSPRRRRISLRTTSGPSGRCTTRRSSPPRSSGRRTRPGSWT
jgi:hypothetical protein